MQTCRRGKCYSAEALKIFSLPAGWHGLGHEFNTGFLVSTACFFCVFLIELGSKQKVMRTSLFRLTFGNVWDGSACDLILLPIAFEVVLLKRVSECSAFTSHIFHSLFYIVLVIIIIKVYISENFHFYLNSDVKFALKWHWWSICKSLLVLVTEREVLYILLMTATEQCYT